MADLQAMVQEKSNEYSAMLQSKDWHNLAKLYTEDCAFMPPGVPEHRGRNGLAAYMAELLSGQDISHLTLTTDDVISAGSDFVIERGKLIVHNEDGAVLEDGKYVNVWKRVGASLQLYADIWNRNTSD